MRRFLVVLALASLQVALATGCGGPKQKYRAAPAQPADTTASDVGVDIRLEEGAVLKKEDGILIAPVRVTNHKDRFIQVYYNNCEIEETGGARKKRFPGRGEATMLIGPGQSKVYKYVFGQVGNGLEGSAFRIYLWIETTDGAGLIDGLPYVQVGEGNFKELPRPFTRAGSPARAGSAPLPPPTEPPPSRNQPVAGDKPCKHCGEMRQPTGACPHCGIP